ncbi:MAG TPA: homoserine dehydrogenase [Candidatus Eisenbacteria bacterium]|jgi:homoserine dehydrogenase|nr:homoserine dehydrogenase [Candidatus Eisenbacteria bacterium]
MNSPLKIGMLGCGVVGTGLLHLLRDRASEIEQAVGAQVKVTRVAVADPKKPREAALDGATLGGDAMAVAEADDIDLLVEVMGGADRALPPVTRALERGLPVVTANKLLVANHGAELEAVAARTGAMFRYEASVAGVIPVLQSLDHGLRTERFQLLVGILNGTTNYILSTMEREGRDFAEALEAARKLGFAESDPSLDLSGADTAQKLTILVRRAFPASIDPSTIPTEGIVGMELEDLRQADRFGYVAKLLGIAMRTPGGLDVRVHPAFIPKRYLLAAVRDEFNGIYLRGEASGSMMLYGKGAGAFPTAQAVLGDVLALAREHGRPAAAPKARAGRRPARDEELMRLSPDDVRTKYYVRLIVEDRPGVLAQVAHRLGGAGVSVAQMFQEPGVRGESSITMLTHEARDKDARDAVQAIAALPAIRKKPRAVRIFDI